MKLTTSRGLAVTILTIGFAALSCIKVPLAKAAVDISVHPSSQTITLAPGKAVKKSLLVVNSANVPAVFKVSVQDYKVKDIAGNIQFYRPEGNFSAATWLIPQYDFITIPALDSKKVEYIVSGDKNMPGQGYNGAIVFEAYNAKEQKTFGEPFGTLIILNVLGKGITTGGSIQSFNSALVQFKDPFDFNFTVKNPSNSNLSLSGQVVFTNLFGKEVGRFKTGDLGVYPRASRMFHFQWSDAPVFGPYIATVTMVDALRKDHIVSSWTLILLLPWVKLLLAIAILLLVACLGVFLYRVYIKKTSSAISLKNAFLETGKSLLGDMAKIVIALKEKILSLLPNKMSKRNRVIAGEKPEN